MGSHDPESLERHRPDPARSWPALLLSLRDERLALGLAERLDRDGWRVAWSRRGELTWEAWLGRHSSSIPFLARGRSRLSAITAAHLAAIRRAALARGEVDP